MFGFLNNASADYAKLAYDFQFKSIDGEIIKLSDYQNKVIVVVNVASRCGFTNQYEDLQELWSSYKNKGLIVLGVPTNDFKQEPGSNGDIKNFCETNFNINFLLTEKNDVKGDNAHAIYLWAKKNFGNSTIPKWNFHKILINKSGKIQNTYNSFIKPMSKKLINDLELIL